MSFTAILSTISIVTQSYMTISITYRPIINLRLGMTHLFVNIAGRSNPVSSYTKLLTIKTNQTVKWFWPEISFLNYYSAPYISTVKQLLPLSEDIIEPIY